MFKNEDKISISYNRNSIFLQPILEKFLKDVFWAEGKLSCMEILRIMKYWAKRVINMQKNLNNHQFYPTVKMKSVM